tara:strand:+ start:29 stop:1510 length:1482 start_codon:yes stop_codon:yes gene_type:complete
MKVRDYNHSRPLDVHRWSDYSEVNPFINKLYDNYIKNVSENANIQKKHLKLIILDLFVAWIDDPELNIGVHMHDSAYSDGSIFNKGKSRYNELNIKVSTIKIVHRLRDLGFIGFKKGYEGSVEFAPRVSRIWIKDKLIKLFNNAAFSYFDINYSRDREVIVLRNEDKVDIEYEDNDSIQNMRKVVQDYNELLSRTFIDIPELNIPRIELKEKKQRRLKNKPIYVNISHHDKFTRRVFNNSSFEEGGRFYGGWWQRVDGSHRERIRLNNLPTVEIDFSALHIILAYTQIGKDYWKLTNKDPYRAPVNGVKNPEHLRNINKLFFLLSLNASNETSLFKAFRSELDYKEYPYKFPDRVLRKLLEDIRSIHPQISHLICSGAGLRLMSLDSQIVEYIIKDFIKSNTPILTVHDSFVVPFGQEDRLDKLMKEAFFTITKQEKVNIKYNQNITEKALYASQHQDRNFYLDTISFLKEGNQSKGYSNRLKQHNRWIDLKI